MLGEVALVPKESPINQSGLMFFNTLFDENACCHVAAGAGFSEVLDGFMDMSDEEILVKGINDSLIHVDFMVGSDDLALYSRLYTATEGSALHAHSVVADGVTVSTYENGAAVYINFNEQETTLPDGTRLAGRSCRMTKAGDFDEQTTPPVL